MEKTNRELKRVYSLASKLAAAQGGAPPGGAAYGGAPPAPSYAQQQQGAPKPGGYVSWTQTAPPSFDDDASVG
jgi:hypothetical protein